MELITIDSIDIETKENCNGGEDDAENLFERCKASNGICSDDKSKRCGFVCLGSRHSVKSVIFTETNSKVPVFSNRHVAYASNLVTDGNLTINVLDSAVVCDEGHMLLNNRIYCLNNEKQVGGKFYLNWRNLKGTELSRELQRHTSVTISDECNLHSRISLLTPMSYVNNNTCAVELEYVGKFDHDYCGKDKFSYCAETAPYSKLNITHIYVQFEPCYMSRKLIQSFVTNDLKPCNQDCTYNLNGYQGNGIGTCGFIPTDSNTNSTGKPAIEKENTGHKAINWWLIALVSLISLLAILFLIVLIIKL